MFKRKSGGRTPESGAPGPEAQEKGEEAAPERAAGPTGGGGEGGEGPVPRYVSRRAGEAAAPGRRGDYRPPSAPVANPAVAGPIPQTAGAGGAPERRSETEGRKLVVGREIRLAGEIKKCEKLVVEGEVEANLTDCLSLEIAESGFFNGAAVVEEAEISGVFEGDLTAKGRLYLRSTGRVIGNVRYAELEIERGGKIGGTIDVLDPAAPEAKASAQADSRPSSPPTASATPPSAQTASGPASAPASAPASTQQPEPESLQAKPNGSAANGSGSGQQESGKESSPPA